MLRHALAPMFEPGSLVIVADRPAGGGIPVAGAQGPLHGGRLRRGRGARAARQPERPGAGRASRPGPGLRVAGSAAGNAAPAGGAVARSVILLPHELPDPYPRGTLALCRAWAEENRCELLGPRSFGAQRPHAGLNLSQHPVLARRPVALLAQSRSIMAAVMDWAEDVHIGFSVAVSLGDEAVVGLSKVLDYLASDPRTDSIVLYLEDVGPAREFMSVLRRRQREAGHRAQGRPARRRQQRCCVRRRAAAPARCGCATSCSCSRRSRCWAIPGGRRGGAWR